MADERTEKQKVQEITDKLEEGLKEVFESEKYKTYLSAMSKFHNYSFNNTLLIAMQKPEPTLVAWNSNFVIPLKHIIFTAPFIADGIVLMFFWGL